MMSPFERAEYGRQTELRNPLHGMRATLFFIMSEYARHLNPDLLEDLQTVNACCSNMFTFLNSMLDQQQFARKDIQLRNAPCKPVSVVRDVVNQFFRLASVPLDKTVAPDVPSWVLLDESRLRQVLSNCVSNAIKHTHEGRIQVFLSMLHLNAQDEGDPLSDPDQCEAPRAGPATTPPRVIDHRNTRKDHDNDDDRNDNSIAKEAEDDSEDANGTSTEADKNQESRPASANDKVAVEGKRNETEAIGFGALGIFPGLIEPSDGPQATTPEDSQDMLENTMLKFEVEDTGVGLNGRDPEELFKEFETADNAQHAMMAQTGLGLPICRRIVEAMGGTITLLDYGSGCRTTVLLPCRMVTELDMPGLPGTSRGGSASGMDVLRDDYVDGENSSTPGSSDRVSSLYMAPTGGRAEQRRGSAMFSPIGEAAPLDPNTVQVIVADDEKVNRKIMERMLKKLGMANVTCVSDGLDVLDMLGLTADSTRTDRSKDPSTTGSKGSRDSQRSGRSGQNSSKSAGSQDLEGIPRQDNVVLCLDVVMTNMNGDAVCKKLRRRGWGGPIVACTGNAAADDIAEYMSIGFSAVCTKPFVLSDLHQLLTQRCNVTLPDIAAKEAI